MSTSTDQSFRDSISTADKRGRRIWVYPIKPKGSFYKARSWVSYFLLAFLFGAPFIKVNNEPLLLFDIINRKFVIFSVVFWPQDFYLFVLATITLTVFIVLFTAIYGRLFCGWICPQTIFMEMVFRKIEYIIEGNAGSQKRLNAASGSFEKIFKKGLKHAIFYVISFLIGNIFLIYIIGYEALIEIITDPISEHAAGFSFMLIFSFIFYGVFSWFREQVCTLVCPYGRLQSVLLDDNTIVIAYDHKRGEPRALLGRNDNFDNRGHCIDCLQCVKVCPTGIDIRNGTQLECINCTACIDACNATMKKLSLPTGLIKYASGNGIEKGEKFKFTTRIFGYTIALAFLMILSTVLMANQSELQVKILRTPGMLYQETDDGKIRNLYSMKIINKTQKDFEIELELKSPEGEITIIGGEIELEEDGLTESVFFVDIYEDKLYTVNSLIIIDVIANGELIDEVTTSFTGPGQNE